MPPLPCGKNGMEQVFIFGDACAPRRRSYLRVLALGDGTAPPFTGSEPVVLLLNEPSVYWTRPRELHSL